MFLFVEGVCCISVILIMKLWILDVSKISSYPACNAWRTAARLWNGIHFGEIKCWEWSSPARGTSDVRWRSFLCLLSLVRAHVTPLFISLHWLPVAARIKFKTLMLEYRTATGSAPSYFFSFITIYIPSRSLRSASEQRLVVPCMYKVLEFV